MLENDLLPCPMCGSPAKIECTGSIECYGYSWQILTIECTRTLDSKCGMNISLNADMFYIDNSSKILIDAWNKIRRNKT
ncbi:MAG: Lar family restriction alleviation protein [Candidatus Woesearchaeota archaeon]